MTGVAGPGTSLPHSLALHANLEQLASMTAAPHLQTLALSPEEQQLLRQPVADRAGVVAQLDRLLAETNHRFPHPATIVTAVRDYMLEAAVHYQHTPHEEGCYDILLELLFRVLRIDLPSLEPVHASALTTMVELLHHLLALLSPDALPHHAGLLARTFRNLAGLQPSASLQLAQTHPSILAVLRSLLHIPTPNAIDLVSIRILAVHTLKTTYHAWLEYPDPEPRLRELGLDRTLWQPVSHDTLLDHMHTLAQLEREAFACMSAAWIPGQEHGPGQPHEALVALLALPNHLDLVRAYRAIARALNLQATDPARRTYPPIQFLFRMLEIDVLGLLHDTLLRDIQRALVTILQSRSDMSSDVDDDVRDVLLQSFAFLAHHPQRSRHVGLQYIDLLGQAVLQHGHARLTDLFVELVIRFGFEWSTRPDTPGHPASHVVNPLHLDNIRVWLNRIVQRPSSCAPLISALTIHLRMTGTCIRDTDLFQKQVTRLLNSPIRPVLNLVKQFARILPVYFNEIGAEGELRTVSTELDELTGRRDRIVHFLRKQCHVDSTNHLVDLVRTLLQMWHDGTPAPLVPFLPEELQAECASPAWQREFLSGVHQLTAALFAAAEPPLESVDDLLNRPVATLVRPTPGPTDTTTDLDWQRVMRLIRLYQIVHRKYRMTHPDLMALVQQSASFLDMPVPDIGQDDDDERLKILLDLLEQLHAVIVSDQTFPATEEIYHKRHIALGMPSTYGAYRERKFDALALTLRLENATRVYLERLLERIPEDFITRATCFRIVKYSRFFLRALMIDGIVSRKLQQQLDILQQSLNLAPVSLFSFKQYQDMMRNVSLALQDIVTTYYRNTHHDPLSWIVPMIPRAVLLPEYRRLGGDDDGLSASELFLRQTIAESFGLQTFDRFIRAIQRVMEHQRGTLDPRGLDWLMTYDPANLFCPIHAPEPRTDNRIHLGTKGYNLLQLAQQGHPVPAGVVLTTEFFRCRHIILRYPPARSEFMERLHRQIDQIGAADGMVFGDPAHPLLLSIRSGALISMPGMMQTIHNVGIHETMVETIAEQTGNPYFAWDTYRRFIQSWSMGQNLPRALFSDGMREHKRRCGVRKKIEFTAEQMADLALIYRSLATGQGIVIPDDPWEQLAAGIELVIHSWHTPKARTYRRLLEIADDWGTAVILQRMVFGNRHAQSGSGVVFTQPFGAQRVRRLDPIALWGDYTPGNQGEDIVGGLVATRPIARDQCRDDGRDPDTALESCFPEIYARLLAIAHDLVGTHRWDPQEFEFTFDGPGADRLFLLQSRDMLARDPAAAAVRRFREIPDRDVHLARGLGVSGGALCGRIVVNGAAIETLRSTYPNDPLILVRYDTVPEDIREVALTDGLLTARGGQTSHAALVAARLRKVCVVGCEAMVVHERTESCVLHGTVLHQGDPVGIDGRTGLVLRGWHAIESGSFGDGEVGMGRTTFYSTTSRSDES